MANTSRNCSALPESAPVMLIKLQHYGEKTVLKEKERDKASSRGNRIRTRPMLLANPERPPFLLLMDKDLMRQLNNLVVFRKRVWSYVYISYNHML